MGPYGDMVAAHGPPCYDLSRSLFEIFMALNLQSSGSGCSFEVIMPRAEEQSFNTALLKVSGVHWRAWR